MTKSWEQRPAGRRRSETQERRRVLIACEDSKSSRYYLESFPVDPRRTEVVCIGTGMNTDSLVEEVLRLVRESERRRQPYSEVWCVFDRDSFPMASYVRAFAIARKNRLKVAWTNEAFELWYLLHYGYIDSGIGRKDYRCKLRDCGLVYDKADKGIYAKVKPHMGAAIRNARKLERHWRDMGKFNSFLENPSTGVHNLVEFLNELADLGAA